MSKIIFKTVTDTVHLTHSSLETDSKRQPITITITIKRK